MDGKNSLRTLIPFSFTEAFRKKWPSVNTSMTVYATERKSAVVKDTTVTALYVRGSQLVLAGIYYTSTNRLVLEDSYYYVSLVRKYIY